MISKVVALTLLYLMFSASPSGAGRWFDIGSQYSTYLYANQDPTGELQLPLITLHTTSDLFVPISQQQLLRRLAEEAGTGDLLIQRAGQASGHCSMLKEEWTQSLEDLIRWVEADELPEGEK